MQYFRNGLADVEELPELQDIGWRYVSLKNNQEENHDDKMTNSSSDTLPSEFFIWPTDNF